MLPSGHLRFFQLIVDIHVSFFCSRFMNQYFLLIACLQLWSLITPVNPASTWGPLIFIFAVSATKEAWDDYNRFLSDKNANEKEVWVVKDGIRKHVRFASLIFAQLFPFSTASSVYLAQAISTQRVETIKKFTCHILYFSHNCILDFMMQILVAGIYMAKYDSLGLELDSSRTISFYISFRGVTVVLFSFHSSYVSLKCIYFWSCCLFFSWSNIR